MLILFKCIELCLCVCCWCTQSSTTLQPKVILGFVQRLSCRHLLPPKQTATIVNIWASLARSFLTIKIDGNWPLGIDLSSSMMDIPNTGCASKFWTPLQNLLRLPVLVKNGLILGLRLYLRKFFETQRR